LARLREFLAPKSENAAGRAIAAIRQGMKVIAALPTAGRTVEELPSDVREWIIEFGHGAYIVLYSIRQDEIVVLAIRHSREAGY
jgi:plasmid stabilization system protein ParE